MVHKSLFVLGTCLVVGVLGALALVSAPSTTAPARTDRTSPVVVELFTSQGCSSCPPADALLEDLTRRSDLLPLAFHIDYWDRLGWRDPFSSPQATDRQKNYARLLRLSSAYTPQMVINGRADVVGSDRRRVMATIDGQGSLPVSVALTADGNGLLAAIGAGSGEGKLWLVTFDRSAETRVPAGENAGRTILNVNIVRAINDVGVWDGDAKSLRLARPADGKGGPALLLQAPSGAILGAASLSLS